MTRHLISQKRYKIELYLQWQAGRKLYTIYRAVPFSITLNQISMTRHLISQKRYKIEL